MNRCFLTSDTHGQFKGIKEFCYIHNTTLEDIILILGDVGLNYFCDGRDIQGKEFLSKIPATFLCIHGNHEERAYNLSSYQKVYNEELKCYIYVEEKYPNILFLEDGIFYLKGKNV